MKVTERHFKRALRNATAHAVSRYLMSNAHGRQDGGEKARQHIELCETFVSALCDVPKETVGRKQPEEYEAVHTGTQALTGYMDVVIGFPLDERPDYDVLEPMFFDEFYRLAVKSIDDLDKKPRRRR